MNVSFKKLILLIGLGSIVHAGISAAQRK